MDAVRDCIHAHMETVLNIEKTLQFIAALPQRTWRPERSTGSLKS